MNNIHHGTRIYGLGKRRFIDSNYISVNNYNTGDSILLIHCNRTDNCVILSVLLYMQYFKVIFIVKFMYNVNIIPFNHGMNSDTCNDVIKTN